MFPMTTRRASGRLLAAVGALSVGLAACGPVAEPRAAGPVRDVDTVDGVAPTPTSDPSSDQDPVRPSGPDTEQAWEPVDTETSATPAPTPDPTSEPTSEPAEEEQALDVLERGDRGEEVARVQRRLVELGYWLGPTDGVYGHLTEQAVLALQGWEGITRDGRVGPETRRTLAEASRPVPDHDGDLVEIHRSQGVLLVVRDGATRWAIHTSTGTGEYYTQPDGDRALADTPAGTWTVDWQVDGWRESFLGRLWRPKYFHEHGLAIHGYHEVPAWPASHGCARVSMEAMNLIWEQGLAPVGSTVVVS